MADERPMLPAVGGTGWTPPIDPKTGLFDVSACLAKAGADDQARADCYNAIDAVTPCNGDPECVSALTAVKMATFAAAGGWTAPPSSPPPAQPVTYTPDTVYSTTPGTPNTTVVATAPVTSSSRPGTPHGAGGLRPQWLPIGGPVGGAIGLSGPWGIAITIGGIIGSLFGFGGGSVDKLLKLFGAFRTDMMQIADSLMRFAWKILSVLGMLLGVFHDIWVSVLRPLLDAIKRIAARIAQIVDKILKPYLQWMRRIQKIIRDLYERYVRPVMVILQKVRRVLHILALLHVPFAAKLDRKLARIQAKVYGYLGLVLRHVNVLCGWLNVILTNRVLIQRAVLINSLYAYQGQWINMFYQGQQAVTDTSLGGGPPAPAPAPTDLELRSQLHAALVYNSGPLADEVAADLATLRAGLLGWG